MSCSLERGRHTSDGSAAVLGGATATVSLHCAALNPHICACLHFGCFRKPSFPKSVTSWSWIACHSGVKWSTTMSRVWAVSSQPVIGVSAMFGSLPAPGV